ncbi:MAG TPA: hypothetical protein VFM04_09750 [Candidatus Methylomirabilis sp.]|nr:hypothetical protein [Candidatus Methylomirabilis sp.]
MFGYVAEEVVGQSLDIIIPEKLRERHWDGYHRVMTRQENSFFATYPGGHIHPAGRAVTGRGVSAGQSAA